MNIGDQLGSSGDATVADSAMLVITNNLRVGNNGTGPLTIRNMATVSANVVNIGVAAGSNGSVDVAGLVGTPYRRLE